MKVIKRGLFLLVILVFEVGMLRPALANGESDPPNPLPANGTYSFAMVGANVNTTADVPTTAISGVYTVAGGSTTFAVSNGQFFMNDDGRICTAQFSGTGTPVAPGITSGFMNLTLSNLSGPNCDALSPNGVGTPTTLTFYYAVSSINGIIGGLNPSRSVMFIEIADTNTIAAVGEGQKQ
jgi:hypothetical protein